MEKVLIDTDVIIDYLRGYKIRVKTVFESIENKKLKAYVSSISVIELFSGKDAAEKNKAKALRDLLSYFEILVLDLETGIIAGEIKRKYDFSLADAAIAATAQLNGLPLFTFNTKHFLKLSNLILYSVLN